MSNDFINKCQLRVFAVNHDLKIKKKTTVSKAFGLAESASSEMTPSPILRQQTRASTPPIQAFAWKADNSTSIRPYLVTLNCISDIYKAIYSSSPRALEENFKRRATGQPIDLQVLLF